MHPVIREHRDDILRLARTHGARNVRLFGSAVRGDDRAESDPDLLVDMEEGRSLVDRVALKQDLEDLLGREIDGVTEEALHPRLRDRVLEESVVPWYTTNLTLSIIQHGSSKAVQVVKDLRRTYAVQA